MSAKYKFYVLADNENIYYEDYEHFDGMTVGVLSTCSQTSAIHDLCDAQDISVNLRYYATTDALENALANGDVDAIYAITVSDGSTFRIVAHFANTHLYFATPKGSGLLSELTAAVAPPLPSQSPAPLSKLL
jgi:ABC-type amino acid transport substrate-binding protein